MKIFVLGAGYVGTALLPCLCTKGHEVHASTTKHEKIDGLKRHTEHIHVVKGTDRKLLKGIIDHCDAMVVLVAPKDHTKYEETYLHTAKIITSILEEKEEPFYLLYTSSTGVYEGALTEWVDEESTLHPTRENSKILVETENTYQNCANDYVTTCILRLAGIYGPERELLHRALHFAGKELPGSGNTPTNHIHLTDIIAGIEFCLHQRLEGVYNLANDDHPTRNELYSDLCRMHDLQPPTWNPNLQHDRPGGYKVSNKKMKGEGFVFTHSLS